MSVVQASASMVIDDLPEEIEAYLFYREAHDDGDALPEGVTPPPEPRIDRHAALRLMRHLGRQRRAAAEEDAAYATEIDRLKEARQRAADRARQRQGYAEAMLASYLRSLMVADPRAKSVNLEPYGRIESRTPSKPGLNITDRKLLARWVAANAAEFVRVVEPDVAWDQLKPKVEVTADGRPVLDGAPLPGIEVKPIETTITVRTTEGDAAS